MNDLQAARERDRKHRLLIDQETERWHHHNVHSRENILPYNKLSNGLYVLDEADPEFQRRLAMARFRTPRPGAPLSARGKM